jgi:hypothetical protein
MSVHVSSWVWKHSKARGPQLIVLLYLADKADDDGCNRWPRGIERMARECRMSERGLQMALKKLRESGQVQAVGKNETGCVAYRVVIDAGAQPAPETSLDNDRSSSVSGSSVAVVRDVLGAPRAGVQTVHPPDGGPPRTVCRGCGEVLVDGATSCPCEVWSC